MFKPKRQAIGTQDPYLSMIADVQRLADPSRSSLAAITGALGATAAITVATQFAEMTKAANLGAGPLVGLAAVNTSSWLSNQLGAERLTASWSTGSLASKIVGQYNLAGRQSDVFADFRAANNAAYQNLGFGVTAAMIKSIASSVAPYQLPSVGLMTDLAAVRSFLDTETPLSRSVDRIGKGWASLSHRLVGGDLDLAGLMPSSNRLATKAYELDILVGYEEPTDSEELLTTRRNDVDVVAEYLARLNASLGDRWNGLWDRMDQRGPDWQSQAANSAVELMKDLLEVLAPDDMVREWQVASGQYQSTTYYLNNGKGGPTRRLKLRYLGHHYRVSGITVESLFMGVPDAIKALQGVKHGSTNEVIELNVSLLGDVVTMLVPNRRASLGGPYIRP